MSTTARNQFAMPAQRTQRTQPGVGQPGTTAPNQRPAPAPRTTRAPEKDSQTQGKLQQRTIGRIIVAAAVSVSLGILWFSGNIKMQSEVNRRVKLRNQLQRVEERSRVYAFRKAKVGRHEFIELQARQAHMILADDNQAIVLGQAEQTRSEQNRSESNGNLAVGSGHGGNNE